MGKPADHSTAIWVAAIGAIATLVGVVIANYDKIFGDKQPPPQPLPSPPIVVVVPDAQPAVKPDPQAPDKIDFHFPRPSDSAGPVFTEGAITRHGAGEKQKLIVHVGATNRSERPLVDVRIQGLTVNGIKPAKPDFPIPFTSRWQVGQGFEGAVGAEYAAGMFPKGSTVEVAVSGSYYVDGESHDDRKTFSARASTKMP